MQQLLSDTILAGKLTFHGRDFKSVACVKLYAKQQGEKNHDFFQILWDKVKSLVAN
jgi:hypothetical protein